MITVKKDQTVKLALDSKKINKFIRKNKYQMPNIDLLLDNLTQVVKSNDNQQTLFSTLDLRYAYSQILLDKPAREQCNFSLIGGNATGTQKGTNMSRKPDVKQYKGGFIPDELKSLNPRVRKEEKLDNWQGTSDREESLSDSRWHK